MVNKNCKGRLRIMPILLSALLIAIVVLTAALTKPVPLVRACSTCNFLLKWGSAGPGNGQFNRPEGVAVDSRGNVYVADSGSSRVEKFAGTGTFITTWGSTGSLNGQFIGAGGIAVDSSGHVYVADVGSDRFEKFTSSGGYISQ